MRTDVDAVHREPQDPTPSALLLCLLATLVRDNVRPDEPDFLSAQWSDRRRRRHAPL
ncbi:hypothetical protein OG548_23280 [Streptomyces sp. NBC_01356]|uniref:hypothetical protein n=1 Tax=Streptomyces sp. NBC_01356 TaxID=2903836 RepID=UPI002E30002B|nr:hypothetical protein [Streptomyces sp. NBC_01356]